MPMYEYKCPTCDCHFEKLIAHSKADEVICETCQTKAERQLSRFGVCATGGQPATMSPAAQGRSSSGGCHGGMCGHSH